MEDIPQPAPEPYSVGDRVRIYLDPADPDDQYHDRLCEIVSVLTDELDTQTGRRLDAFSYVLCDVETGEEIPVTFRHRDIVATTNDH